MRNGTTKSSKASSENSVQITPSAIPGCPMRLIRNMRLGKPRSNGNSLSSMTAPSRWPLDRWNDLDPNPRRRSTQGDLGGIFFIAAPFVGDGGWHSEDIQPSSISARNCLTRRRSISITEARTVRPIQAWDLNANAIPRGVVRNSPVATISSITTCQKLPPISDASELRAHPLYDLFLSRVAGERRKEVDAVAKKRQQRRWVRKVKTDSTHPPPRTFAGSASQIARTMARKNVSPRGLGSAIRMIQVLHQPWRSTPGREPPARTRTRQTHSAATTAIERARRVSLLRMRASPSISQQSASLSNLQRRSHIDDAIEPVHKFVIRR